MKQQAIGIFDSGVGGLTVAKEIVRLLPDEDIIYLGDTARVPYGTRNKETINHFATELTQFMLRQNVKAIVVACNTISATSLDAVTQISTVPIINVIAPSVKKIISTTDSSRVGIIGTKATINSRVYERNLKKLKPDITVISVTCPLFVPIVEEGLADSDIAVATAKLYLSQLGNIDTLHLGCTHYPLLRNTIRKVIGEKIAIIDSAMPTAEELRTFLQKNDLLNVTGGNRRYFVTDDPVRTAKIAMEILDENISSNISKITL
jgi:glutamate racemase